MTAEGSLGASFIPVFTGYLRNRSAHDAWDFARKVFWDLALFLAVLSVLGVVFSKQLIGMFTLFGHNPGQWGLAISLNKIIFPAVLFIGLAALASAILNSFHVFGLPAATSIFFNLALIAFSLGIVYRPIMRWLPANLRTPAVALAIGILVGGMIQFGSQVPALAKRGMTFAPEISLIDPGVQKVARLMGPSFFGMGVYQVNLFVDTIFATSPRMPTGSVASLYVADRVMQLVLGSYAIAMSTALLPALSHSAAAGKWDEMKHTLGFSLRIVSFITIPAAIGLILLRRPIVQVLFQHGRFASDSTALTSHALLYYSLGLPAFAAIKLITPMYYSTQDTLTPAKIGAWALGMNVALNSVFLLFFFRTLSNAGPALASSLTAYCNFGVLFLFFRKRHGHLGMRGLAGAFTKMTLCATAMALAASFTLRFSRFSTIDHVVKQAGVLAAMILFAVTVYLVLAWLLRCEELSEFWSLLRRAKAEPAAVAASGA